MIKLTLKILLPLVALSASLMGAYAIILAAPEIQPRPQEDFAPIVHTIAAEPSDVRLDVEAYGTVRPRTVVRVVPQVAGRAEYVSPSLREGGFIEKDEALIRIERRDYELAVTQAQAAVAQAQARLDRETAEAEIARKEWEAFGKGEPNPLVLRKPQLAEAAAGLASAKAHLAGAELNLERTEIKAPFDGRVRSRSVDKGQFLLVGSPVAEVYATDYAEVRLSLPDDQLAFLDLPLDDEAKETQYEVTLKTVFAGKEFEWAGVIMHTGAEVDPRSRVVRVLARVEKPYEPRAKGQPPLMVGTYVRAFVKGRMAKGVFVLPTTALRGRDRVWVVDGESRLRFRTVKVLRRLDSSAIVESGLKKGDRICVTPIEPAVDGMLVRVEEEDSP